MQDRQKKEHSDFTRTQMKKETILCEMQKQGRRVTKQRKILLDVILEEQCSCCKEIYYEAIKKDATIGMATVYRMVNSLEAMGAISRDRTYKVQYREKIPEEERGFFMQLGQSLEDYLKTIYLLQRQQVEVRNFQIAEMLGRSKPSVTAAVNLLEEKGYVEKKAHGNICLTVKGQKLADNIFRKNYFFQKMLVDAGVDPGQAEREACKLEHILSDDSFGKLRAYVERGK